MKTKTIDGIEFTVAPFPALEALRFKSYLLKTLGPAFAEAADIFKSVGGNADADISGNSLCSVVEKLTANLDEEGFVALVKRMFKFTTAKGKTADGNPLVAQFGDDFESNFNRVFAGRLFSIYPVMLLVLEANYPDFFGKVAGSIGSLTRRINTFALESANETAEPKKSEA